MLKRQHFDSNMRLYSWKPQCSPTRDFRLSAGPADCHSCPPWHFCPWLQTQEMYALMRVTGMLSVHGEGPRVRSTCLEGSITEPGPPSKITELEKSALSAKFSPLR